MFDPNEAVTLWTGTVTHRHGNGVWVAPSAEALDRRIALGYCAEWLKELKPEHRAEVQKALDAGDYARAVEAYFEEHPTEYIDIAADTLVGEDKIALLKLLLPTFKGDA